MPFFNHTAPILSILYFQEHVSFCDSIIHMTSTCWGEIGKLENYTVYQPSTNSSNADNIPTPTSQVPTVQSDIAEISRSLACRHSFWSTWMTVRKLWLSVVSVGMQWPASNFVKTHRASTVYLLISSGWSMTHVVSHGCLCLRIQSNWHNFTAENKHFYTCKNWDKDCRAEATTDTSCIWHQHITIHSAAEN